MAGETLGQHRCDRLAGRLPAMEDVEASIGDRFAAQVEAHGPCLAIRDRVSSVTYADLGAWAGGVAARLADVGVRPGARVVLLLDQGAPAIAATLGTLLAGAAYVPLDPIEPDARLRALLDRVRPGAFLTDDAGSARLARLGVGAPVLSASERTDPGDHRPPPMDPGAPASIFFTSGTTGAPKGVVDCHRNILHNAFRYVTTLGIGPDDRLTLVQPPSSSATMSSTFAALLVGAALLPYRLDAASLPALVAWLRAERATVYHSVPSILRRALAFGGDLPDVRVLRLEGDRSYGGEMAVWRRALPPDAVVANGLGLTETGLCRQLRVPVGQDVDEGIMPVGYPVPDMEVSVVDDDGSPVGEGVAGEIAVTSRYLALGYLDDPVLTAAAFRAVAGRAGWRTYRTGDLGRLRPDGCLEYLGRRDGQSKVLGHRVEPAEVEQALASLAGVRAVAVRIVDRERGEGRVVAWVVCDDGTDLQRLRAAAEAVLPPWMRPARYVQLEALPLAATGKVDRDALREPSEVAAAPVTGPGELEPTVMAIVRGVLGAPIGRDDDFFQAGGDSLGAIDVLLALETATGRRLPASIVLAEPTVARLAAAIADGAGSLRPTLVHLGGSGDDPPLLLLPSHHGHPLAYASLARHLAATRQVLASDASLLMGERPDARFEDVAARYAQAIRDARLARPFLLGGFCFGGAMAYEVARQMMDTGDGPAGLCLIGVSPYDLPDLVPPDALERWRRATRSVGPMAHATRFARALSSPIGRALVADRLRSGTRTARESATRAGRARRRARAVRDDAVTSLTGQYRGPALDLPVTVILPSWRLADYCTDPVALWARVGSTVDVHVVAGVERMMLSEPMVADVARVIASDLGVDRRR